jgi:hypothetical protein
MAEPQGENKSESEKSSLVGSSANNKLAESSITQQLDDFKKEKSAAAKDKDAAVKDQGSAADEKQSAGKGAVSSDSPAKDKSSAAEDKNTASKDKSAAANVHTLEIPPPAELHKQEIHQGLAEHKAWEKLGAPKILWPIDKSPAMLYQFHMKHSAMNLVVSDMSSNEWQLRPAIHTALEPTSKDGIDDKVTCVINGGYFGGRASVSYLKIGEQVFDTSQGIRNNPRFKGRAEAIISRSEIRILKDKQQNFKLDIARHTDPAPAGYVTEHALQAGPNLLDTNGNYDNKALANEGFVRPKKDQLGHRQPPSTISADAPDARTAIGITADGHLLMLSVAGKNDLERSRGVTIEELAGIMKDLGCVKALNLDGGSSTTMYVRTAANATECAVKPGTDVNANRPERPVKSFLELVHNVPSPSKPAVEQSKSLPKNPEDTKSN